MVGEVKRGFGADILSVSFQRRVVDAENRIVGVCVQQPQKRLMMAQIT